MTKTNTPSRRLILAGGVAGAAASTIAAATSATAAPAVQSAPAINRNLPDVVVVGAGAFGGWTALALREAGAKVTMVDQYGAGNVRGSSAGESRNIRASYGDREIYTRMAMMALGKWDEREEEFGRKLIYKNGSLRVLEPGQLQAQIEIFTRLGLPFEMLKAADVHERWPQLRFRDDEDIFYEKATGIVKAREAMIAVEEVFVRKGGVSRIGVARFGETAGGKLNSITVNDEALSAGSFVFACGPWLPQVMPDALTGYISAPRRELFFIGSAPGDMRYRAENVPNISDRETFTSADLGSGYKIGGGSIGGVPMDMDGGERMPTDYLKERVEDYIARRLPGLVGQPVITSHVCQTEGSDNGHFIIDSHPAYGNAWIAGGGSGHAFKMGPVLGEILRNKVLGQPDIIDDGGVFAYAAHRAHVTTTARR